jgi:spermidine synthase
MALTTTTRNHDSNHAANIGARHSTDTWATSDKYIATLFLISGFSALIYQVVWQRVLFTTFGINTEAVTVIVSVFMFGLGIGALAGGYLQKRYPTRLLQIFLALEILIACFGLLSLDLIHWIGGVSNNPGTPQLVMWTYVILALPTLLMGATLPILVAYLQQYFHNLGRTVGLLYAFNTIGSAIAALVTVQVLFVLFGQKTAVMVAAGCNFLTAALIFDASRRLQLAKQAGCLIGEEGRAQAASALPQHHLPFRMAFLSLMLVGYISLSQEILWYRLLGYLTGGKPQVFGMLLAAFLVGIAAGSLRAKKLCETGSDPYRYLVQAMLLTAVVFYLATPAAAWLTSTFDKQAGPYLIYPIIGLVAFFTGGVLPMLVHVGVARQDGDSTQVMSWLYFANIIGATLGPMLTGFILLDHFTLEGNVVILTGITLAFVLALLAVIPKPMAWKRQVLGVMLALVAGAGLLHDSLFADHMEKIQYGTDPYQPFRYKLENRGGIITVAPGPNGAIYGTGIYDGRFNTDPVLNNNYIDRAYMIAALHRKPQRILEIGLSSGSWTRAITMFEPVTSMSVVEINKGYVEVIRNYPDIAQALTHPKLTLYFDDGRRWLRNHDSEKFDFIVMNTTYHWRSNATNLLSKEFLELIKSRLNPGGVIYYNTTDSRDVVHTAAHVFSHVTMYRNFVAASDAPFDMTPEEKRVNLLQFKLPDGSPLFERNAKHRAKLEELANYRFPELHDSILKERGLMLVTDDNMAVEYKLK